MIGMAGRSATSSTMPLGRTSRWASGVAGAIAGTASSRASTTTTTFMRTSVASSSQGFLLVHALVVSDLTEHVGQRFEPPVIGGDHALERLALQLGAIPHELHVLVLGVIFEFGGEEVGAGRAHDVEQADDLIVYESQQLGQQ